MLLKRSSKASKCRAGGEETIPPRRMVSKGESHPLQVSCEHCERDVASCYVSNYNLQDRAGRRQITDNGNARDEIGTICENAEMPRDRIEFLDIPVVFSSHHSSTMKGHGAFSLARAASDLRIVRVGKGERYPADRLCYDEGIVKAGLRIMFVPSNV